MGKIAYTGKSIKDMLKKIDVLGIENGFKLAFDVSTQCAGRNTYIVTSLLAYSMSFGIWYKENRWKIEILHFVLNPRGLSG